MVDSEDDEDATPGTENSVTEDESELTLTDVAASITADKDNSNSNNLNDEQSKTGFAPHERKKLVRRWGLLLDRRQRVWERMQTRIEVKRETKEVGLWDEFIKKRY